MKGKESPTTDEVMEEAGWKRRAGGRHQRESSSHSRKARRRSETLAPCEGLEPKDARQGARSGRVEEGRRSARSLRRVMAAMWKTTETRTEGGNIVDKRLLVQFILIEYIYKIARKQRGKRKALRAKIESVERVYPLYRVSSEVFIVNIIERPLGGPL